MNSIYTIEQQDAELRNSRSRIRYLLSFERAAQHLISVELTIEDPPETLQFYLPTWTPGSYKIREFLSNLGDLFVQTAEGTDLSIQWLSKNRFKVDSINTSTLRIHYTYFAHEFSVRTSFVNRWYAFLMPSNFCLAIDGMENEVHHVELSLPSHWKTVATALSPVDSSSHRYGAKNYDILIDSPIQITSHPSWSFTAFGIPHQLSIIGDFPLPLEWLIDALKKIVETEAMLFDELPYDRYVFFLHFLPNSSGGLEHSRSSVSSWDPQKLDTEENLQKFLTLLAHEFFHVWNGKRIRPVELGPFNYEQENYTTMLWLVEGMTSYYNDLFLYRAGFATLKQFLKILARERITRMLQQPGHSKLSLADSSFLSWVKLYHATPDSPNRFPSYYLKGSIACLLLDLWIIIQSRGRASLDTVVSALWQRYKQHPQKGIDEEEFFQIAESATSVAIKQFFHPLIHSTSPYPLGELFQKIGIRIQKKVIPPSSLCIGETKTQTVPPEVWTGMRMSDAPNGVRIEAVYDNSPAAKAGIGVDDILLAVNNRAVSTAEEAIQLLAEHRNSPITLHLLCAQHPYTTELIPEPAWEYQLLLQNPNTVTADVEKLRNYWLQRPLRTANS